MKFNKRIKISLSLLLVLSLLVAVSCSKKEDKNVDLEAGLAYLTAQEEKDPAEVDNAIQAIKQQRMDAQREELLQQLISGERDVWGMFSDAAVLGDSRAVGFSYYDYLSGDRVLATSGERITSIVDHYEELHALNPSYIFLCYGLNDIVFWDGAEEYAQGYGEILTDLQNEFPNATIIVSSILSVFDPAFEKESDWYQLPDYSAAVAEYCQENGIPFANNDELCAGHSDLWQPDGIHLLPDFYHYWASNLILTMLESSDAVAE